MAEYHSTPLHRLHDEGQSVWLDYIRRGILEDGELERMIGEYALRGVTSNPTIFEQAISESDDYDDALERLAADGMSPAEVYESLAIEDIRRAADLFRPIHDASAGTDGFVSLEVSPELARDTAATLEEARRLWRRLDRPNVMVKVPGTPEGAIAVEQLVFEGVNVNVTLLFSLEGYTRVMEAYLRGLERRMDTGEPVERVASVASFFVSRVDSAVDAELTKLAEAAEDGARRTQIESLMGRAAIDNAKMAYGRFHELFFGGRWDRLRAAGAQVQRPLWASTSTKNPDYRDVIYVEELIGPHTVNTMPLATARAFADHGEVRRAVDQDLGRVRAELKALREVGIDLEAITARLQVEGVEKFAASHRELIECVREKMARVAARG